MSALAALVGAITHARAGRVDWRTAAWMTPPSVVGAFVGGFFAGAVPERGLLGLIALVLVYSGLDILFGLGLRARPPSDPRAIAVAAGALIGLLGGAVGLILGTLRLPALLKGVALPPHAAVGTNLLVGFFLGVAGFAGHLARLEVEWLLLAVAVGAAVPGAWLGARLGGRLSEQALRRAIGVALLGVAVAIAVSAAT